MRSERADGETVRGHVIEVLPNLMYRIELQSGQKILAHIGSEVRLNLPRIIPGDCVLVRLSPYDSSRGSITGRVR